MHGDENRILRGKSEDRSGNEIIAEDMEYINQRIDHTGLDGSRVLISGATGLIGKYLVRFLAQYCNCTVLALVRNPDRAHGLWEDLGDRVQYLHSDITELKPVDRSADYIIHGASMTSSRSFSAQPAEVIHTSVEGTRRMLDFAGKNPVKSFLFLSTMEVYGAPATDDKISELHGTSLNTMSVRSSYPESKRLCESMCTAWHSEYGIPARVLRLTQTFGPGVEYDDPRIFAEFARCVLEGKDIVLHTEGNTKRSYLYLADACTAILITLLKGSSKEAYNGANENTYCSIKEMAELVASQCASPAIRVRVEPDRKTQERLGYAPELKMNLDTSKLRGLGWQPETELVDMYRRMLGYMVDNRKGNGTWNRHI